jgi:hypothetical protein
VNKTLALDPDAIESARDWEKVSHAIGHEYGLFMANYPKRWASKFLEKELDTAGWGFWDLEKIKEFLILLESTNTFISLNSIYDNDLSWAENYLALDEVKKVGCIAFARREVRSKLPTLDQLDPRTLRVNTTIEEKFSPKTLALNVKVYCQNSAKIAIVDRHNYLTKLDGTDSLFTVFVRELLGIVKGTRCHEILIYAKHEPQKYPYMRSNDSLAEQLEQSFFGSVTPTYGIKYMCCSEYENEHDLHSRKIVTNHVVLLLSDSIAGRTYSQSITRIPDQHVREKNLKSWIDGEHGLDIKATATFKNYKS